jgi:cap2 methyltransferase
VHLGHLLCALATLSKHGAMVLKEFTQFEAPSISLLYLMSFCFAELKIVKPATSRPGNSEIYIIGMDYKKNLSVLQIEKLLQIMKYVRYLNTEIGSPAIFLKKDVPNDFVVAILAIQTSLVESQIANLSHNLELLKKYYGKSYEQMKSDFSKGKSDIIAEWIKTNHLKKLEPNQRMITRSKAI